MTTETLHGGLTRTPAAHRAASAAGSLRTRLTPTRGSLAMTALVVGLALCGLGYSVVAWMVLRVVLSLLGG